VLLNYLSPESFFGCSYKHVLEFERASSKDFRRQKDFGMRMLILKRFTRKREMIK
jgi:hypothetical protein